MEHNELFCLDLLIVACTFVAMVFKWRLFWLTRFWPFAVFGFAFTYIFALRFLALFVAIPDMNEWVVGFWPPAVIGAVGLFYVLRKSYRHGNGNGGSGDSALAEALKEHIAEERKL